MTKKEATVIEMYTGVCMLAGDDRKYFYEYAEKLLGHPIMTHEYLEYAKRLKELSKPDFLKICESVKNDGWIPVEERLPNESDGLVLIQVNGRPKENITLHNALELACYIAEGNEGWILEEYPEWENPDVIAWHPLPDKYQPETAPQRPEWKNRMLHTFLGGHHD